MRRVIPTLVALLIFVSAARADELRLKDGSKIQGKIVGFEDKSFKVETSYGYALIRRDQVTTIRIVEAEKKGVAETKHAAPDTKPTAKPAPEKKAAPESAIAANPAPGMAAAPAPKGAPTETRAPTPVPARPTPASGAPSEPAALVTPANKPAPEPPMREQVEGNSYINETDGFQMYKPPDWDVIEGARNVLPGAIVAMGTADQSTYLIIGLEPAGGTLQAHLEATTQRLNEMFDNYRATGDKQIMVAGSSALEHRFHGGAGGHDWSGVVVFVPHGTRLFTIFGMTYGDSDLVQIQENVISRTIYSLQFTKP